MKPSVALPIVEFSQVGEARRLARSLAANLGFSETLRGQVAIIATELGNNLVKHTRGLGGQLVFRPLTEDEGGGFELLSLDRGPGMSDVARCLSDGYSTAGSSGTGLGAISRLSSVFDLYSQPGQGTVLLSRVIPQSMGRLSPFFEVGAICLPVRGESVSGDAWEARFQSGYQGVMIADGLGHGPLAFEAAREATRSFLVNQSSPLVDQLNLIHLALKRTRGAAVAIAQIDPGASKVRYSGLGNISGVIFSRSGEQMRMVSHNGTAGLQVRKVQEFDYSWTAGSVLVMHSDGISTHWGLEKYPGLLMRHPSVIAGILFRDFIRGRDDASIVVVAEKKRIASWKSVA